MYSEFVKERLKQERLNAGFTQKKLAELTGIDDSLIGKIEVGLRKPDIETIGILAEFYGISIDWLFGLSHKNTHNQNQEQIIQYSETKKMRYN